MYYGVKFRLIFSIILSLIASSFHSGMIPFTFFYILYGSIYFPMHKLIRFNFKSTVIITVGIVVFLVILFAYPDLLISKFSNVNDSTSLLKTVNYIPKNSGSTYLSWLSYSSPIEIILFSPLKVIYFLFSPMIWDIRGISDIVTFILDSTIYMYIIIYLYVNRRFVSKTINPTHHYISRAIILILIITVFLYAFGTMTSGTAIRHRNKLIFVFFILYSIYHNAVYHYKKKYFNK